MKMEVFSEPIPNKKWIKVANGFGGFTGFYGEPLFDIGQDFYT